ncbi:hypothetical protein ACFO5T_12660 [Dokdonia genika]|uniref:GIY-YIG domain-containing protein n=1 Tax=Dokdonia genika TaxID=308113 RepID=A0ABV9LD21_9FLAO
MNFNNRKEIEKHGFKGFKTVAELWLDKSHIPKIKGVYMVIDPNFEKTEFLTKGVGGFFKGKDPNVAVSELKFNLVPNSQVVYIGKAGSPTGIATLNSRLGQYLRFGETKNVGHWGGRYIWQIKNHSGLIFCWKPTPTDDPREIEKQLLSKYIKDFGKRPFANLTG